MFTEVFDLNEPGSTHGALVLLLAAVRGLVTSQPGERAELLLTNCALVTVVSPRLFTSHTCRENYHSIIGKFCIVRDGSLFMGGGGKADAT